MQASFHLTRPISAGIMKVVGQVVHHSGRLIIADSVLTDSDDQESAQGTGTFVPSNIPLSPQIGYE